MYYWNRETGDVIDSDYIEQIYSDAREYDAITGECETLDEYINRCMYSNGDGSLYTVREHYEKVKRELNEKLIVARSCGFEEYTEELADLLAEMHSLSKFL